MQPLCKCRPTPLPSRLSSVSPSFEVGKVLELLGQPRHAPRLDAHACWRLPMSTPSAAQAMQRGVTAAANPAGPRRPDSVAKPAAATASPSRWTSVSSTTCTCTQHRVVAHMSCVLPVPELQARAPCWRNRAMLIDNELPCTLV